MLALSHGVLMAWSLAAGEAARTRQRCIERESVFIGLCQLGSWLRTRTAGDAILPKGDQALRTLYDEAATVEELLWALTLSPTHLCHAVRAAVGRGTYRHSKRTTVHRSKACTTYFHRAEALAAAASASEVHCLHLLAALLEHPGAVLPEAVARCGVEITALHTRVVTTIGGLEARPIPAKSQAQGVSHIIYTGMDLPR